MEPNLVVADSIVHHLDETVETSAEIIPIKPIFTLGTVTIEIAPYGVIIVDNRSTFIRYPTTDMVEDGQVLEYGTRRDEEGRARFFLKMDGVWVRIRFSILDKE